MASKDQEELLEDLALFIQDVLNEAYFREMGFMLVVVPFDEIGAADYVAY